MSLFKTDEKSGKYRSKYTELTIILMLGNACICQINHDKQIKISSLVLQKIIKQNNVLKHQSF